jgi:hypothetical protein
MWSQKPLIFMHFHGVFLGSQHKIWSKQHNGKVSEFCHKMMLIERQVVSLVPAKELVGETESKPRRESHTYRGLEET